MSAMTDSMELNRCAMREITGPLSGEPLGIRCLSCRSCLQSHLDASICCQAVNRSPRAHSNVMLGPNHRLRPSCGTERAYRLALRASRPGECKLRRARRTCEERNYNLTARLAAA